MREINHRKRMKNKFNMIVSLWCALIVVFATGCSFVEQEEKQKKQEKQAMPQMQNGFWDEQRKGTNFMNSTSLPENYEEANEFNIEFIRLAPDKWAKERDFLFDDKPDAMPNKDFLIGNADQYEGIVENDFKMLKEDLDAAYARGSKVVLTVLSLPGNRWRQFNNYENDDRIWQDFNYHEQAALFWKDLALRLKDHPAVVGYNVINEPHPETATGFNDFWTEDYDKWYNKIENTPADLNRLYETIVDSIRSVDTHTPIILDSGLFATPWAINYLKPVEDENVLYAFHMYEPYEMTSQNRKKGFTYTYPGKVKVGNDQNEKMFDKTSLKDFLEPVAKWAEKHNISNNRIIAEEFGINRMVDGADQYMKDLIEIFNDYGWHWAFYAFREDTWDGMDFELGNKPVKEAYWDAQANGELPDRKAIEVDNSIWDVLKKDLNK